VTRTAICGSTGFREAIRRNNQEADLAVRAAVPAEQVQELPARLRAVGQEMRLRILAIRHRRDASSAYATLAHTRGRKTLVTVHDERAQHRGSMDGDAANGAQFAGKEYQVVDVVARWILTGTAPDDIR